MLAFQNEEVYRAAVELVGFAHGIFQTMPADDVILERLRFTTLTIPVDVATVGPTAERKEAHAAARTSAVESAVLLDTLRACGVIDEAAHASGLTLVGRVLAGLKKGEGARKRGGATM